MSETLDMTDTIVAKSDQLNSDDLMGGPRTVTITKVARASTAEQPIAVSFEGDAGKPYMPCKSMRRVMVTMWGPDAVAYAGRSMTLYRDADVTWGGMAVGGIRISHMSHITEPVTLALTATKKVRKPFRVLPLMIAEPPQQKEDRAPALRDDLVARVDAAANGWALYALVDDETVKKQRAWLKTNRPEFSTDVEAAFMAARQRVEMGPP